MRIYNLEKGAAHAYGQGGAKIMRGSVLVCMDANRCTIATVVWTLAAWIVLLDLYLSFDSPSSPLSDFQVLPSRRPIYEELENFQVMPMEVKPPEKPRGPQSLDSPGHLSTRKISPSEDFLNVSSLKRLIFFPDKSLAIDPFDSTESDKYYFYPGRAWHDTDGKPIQAHGGGILFVADTRTFYWYGENKDGRTYWSHKGGTARVDVLGVSCYSSKDLWTWRNEGIVLTAEKGDKSHDLHVSHILERPKVIYNDKTEQYVMWMHIDNAEYTKASIGVAISPSPVGPFKYLYSFRPHGFDSRDMTLFMDDDGEAYVVYASDDNMELHVGVLTDDYLNLTTVFRRILVGMHREAPALFKYSGMYYLITSGCTGWAPNEAKAHTAKSILGSWVTIGNPCLGGTDDFRLTTFYSQGTFVLPLPGLEATFLFMADRWNPHDLRDSRYVWLPLTMDGPADKPLDYRFEFPLWSRVSIRWCKRWRVPDGCIYY